MHFFDILILVVILFLGLKGIINGFFKELFGLVGIVGGIFVASRLGDGVGAILSDLIFKFQNNTTVAFVGFLTTLALFWAAMVFAGLSFKKLSTLSGLGIFDKILGFAFSAGKFFFIVSIIAHSLYNIKAIRTSIDSSMSSSFMFPFLAQTGGYIMKLETVQEENNETNSTKE